jgi:hypothetical protein
VRQIPVRFTGCRAGVGPLTRGQANLLQVLRSGTSICLDAVLATPAGPNLAQVVEAVRQVLARHESLRTRYRLDDDPVQVLDGSGELPLTVHEVEEPATGPVLEQVLRSHWDRPFHNFATEYPVRVAAVACDGAVSHLVVAVSHVAADLTALHIVMSDLEKALLGGSAPPPGPQPLDLIAVERSPAMRRRLQNSLQYWERQLLAAPHSLFPVRHPEADRPYHLGLLTRSYRAAGAIHRAAERARVSRSAVILAALAGLVGHYTGQPTCPVVLPVSNRFLPELRDHVGQLASDSFMLTDIGAAAGFDDLARRVSRDAVRACWHGWFDAPGLWALFDDVMLRRGIRSNAREVVFNDVSAVDADRYGLIGAPMPPPPPGSPAYQDANAWAQLDEGMSWLVGQPFASHLSLDVHGIESEFVAALWMAPRYLAPGELVEFARALERLLLAAGDGDLALTDLTTVTGLAPYPRDSGWYRVDGGWIDLRAVRRLLAKVAGPDCYVTAVPDDGTGHRLVGYVPVAAAELTPQQVHADCVAALPDFPGAMTAHEYVLFRPERVAGTGRAG